MLTLLLAALLSQGGGHNPQMEKKKSCIDALRETFQSPKPHVKKKIKKKRVQAENSDLQ